jgi:hypothetical protein
MIATLPGSLASPKMKFISGTYRSRSVTPRSRVVLARLWVVGFLETDIHLRNSTGSTLKLVRQPLLEDSERFLTD